MSESCGDEIIAVVLFAKTESKISATAQKSPLSPLWKRGDKGNPPFVKGGFRGIQFESR
jgi:hypothetical protein